MPKQGLQRGVRMLGVHKLHQFHLLKLVLTNHAAGVAPVRTRLAAEARSVSGVLQRKRLGLEDHIAREVGHRHLGGRDQIQILRLNVK